MDAIKEKKHWPIALIIIAAVVIASAAIIYSYRDAPGRLPVSAVSDRADGVIVGWQDDSGIYAQRVDSSGQIRRERGGVLIGECPPGSGFDLQSDGLAGAIITWNDRSGIPDDHDDPAYFEPVPCFRTFPLSSSRLIAYNSYLHAPRS
jgi:hypothetical protein